MKERGVFLVPTLYVTFSSDPVEVLNGVSARQRRLPVARRHESFRSSVGRRANAFGTDAGVYPHGLNAREFASMVSLG